MIFKLMLNLKLFIKVIILINIKLQCILLKQKIFKLSKIKPKKFSLPDYSPKHKLVAHEFKRLELHFIVIKLLHQLENQF